MHLSPLLLLCINVVPVAGVHPRDLFCYHDRIPCAVGTQQTPIKYQTLPLQVPNASGLEEATAFPLVPLCSIVMKQAHHCLVEKEHQMQ